jgi:hypothetical protein
MVTYTSCFAAAATTLLLYLSCQVPPPDDSTIKKSILELETPWTSCIVQNNVIAN